MARTSIEKRRKLRELEARRDTHLVNIKKAKSSLASVRAELKHLRSN